MADRPLITANDLVGLMGHGLGRDATQDVEAWIERNGFEPQALIGAARFMVETHRVAMAGDQPLDFKAAMVLALGSFTFGWDAHRDLRGERDDGT